MSNLTFHLISNEDQTFITVFVPGRQPLAADNTHANFEKIVEGAMAGDESVVDLFDLSKTAAAKFEALKFENLAGSDRVTVAGGRVYLDGDEMNNALTNQIVRVIDQGGDFAPLVRFYEKVQANPNEHSREQLYAWLEADDSFTIVDDGDILGYKSVYKQADGTYTSVSSGKAIVNGEVQQGRIPQADGDIVTMPRSEVNHDPTVGCHTGLHVGTYGYASTFSGDTLLEVYVNPTDVVSVPTDCSAQKMRVCRYEVGGEVEKKYDSAVVSNRSSSLSGSEWGDGEGDGEADSDDEFCEECGEWLEDCVCDDPEPDHSPAGAASWDLSKDDEDDDIIGVTFRDNDKRRQGRTLTVVSVFDGVDKDTNQAAAYTTCTSSTTGKNVTVKLDRLLSNRYTRV